ncbi:MAG: mannose-6-phosphate isomerase [Propionibacteriaceae bacterium]|nr:mannose-6-phosphate isomerase [Propionibacteriaceae bacterium]
MDRLHGTIQPYAWGSTTAIAELLGTEPTGEPQAELWLGAHPSAPARLDDRGLDEVIREDPEAVVGAASVAEYGPRLPYLLKVLAAAKPLSLQAHPSRAEAEEGFAREEAAGVAIDAPDRTYRDDWPKPEALCSLGEMEALVGFREPAETYRLFAELNVPAALELVAPLRTGGAEALAEVFERLLRMSDGELELVDTVAAAAAEVIRAAAAAEVARAEAAAEAEADGDLGLFARTATELAEHYPRDAGVLAALLMNRVSCGRHQAIFLPAGNLHAHLHGTFVEIMANSDNVLRGGLTPKHIDVPELLKLLDFTPGRPDLIEGVEQTPGVFAYPTPAPEFALWRVESRSEPATLPGEGSGRVVLCTDGTATLRSGNAELTLSRGQAAFLQATDIDAEVQGDGTLFVAAPGIDGSDQMTHPLNTGHPASERED